MVLLDGGSFTMGCPREQEVWDEDQRPLHQVEVPGFRISRYEITQAVWETLRRPVARGAIERVESA